MSQAEVFIVESLTFSDERKERFEGRILSSILALSGKKCECYYIRTKRELKEVLKQFSVSRYRYLHLSCHGDSESMATTLDLIPFAELGMLLNPHLSSRRLFVSACSMTNKSLARNIMEGSGCRSILGPNQDIRFGDAVVLWASLSHVMFSEDSTGMSGRVLKTKAQEVADIFNVRLTFIRRSDSPANGYSTGIIAPKKRAIA